MLRTTIYWFSSVLQEQVSGDLRLAYLSDLLFGCKDSEKFSIIHIHYFFFDFIKQKGRETCDNTHCFPKSGLISTNTLESLQFLLNVLQLFYYHPSYAVTHIGFLYHQITTTD